MFRPVLIYLTLLALIFSSCRTYIHEAGTDSTFQQVNDGVVADEEITAMIWPYKEEMAEEMEVVIGHLPETLVKARPNSNLGNWFADALLIQANKINGADTDFAIQNYGGLRIGSIPKGPVTIGKIYELMPFDNMLVVLEMDGGTVRALLDKIAASGGWPISKNVSFTIKDDQAADIQIHGKPLQDHHTYRVAMPDYIANGGDGANFLKALPQDNTGLFIRDVIIDYFRDLEATGQDVHISNEKRIN